MPEDSWVRRQVSRQVTPITTIFQLVEHTIQISLFDQVSGLVFFFFGSNGSMSSHYESVKLLEYGISVYFNLVLEIPNGFYKTRTHNQPK